MSDELFDLSEIAPIASPRKATDKSTFILFGAPGLGKSYLAASASEVEAMSPVLMLDFENGSSTLSGHFDSVDVVKIDDWATGASVIEALVHNKTKYRTVIFDSLGSAQDQIKEWSEKVNGGDNGFQKWADVRDFLVKAVKALHATDYHIIATAHLEVDTDEVSRKRVQRPHLLGKKSHVDIPKVADYIGLLTVEIDDEGKKRRVLNMDMDENIVTKNRSQGTLPDFVVDPSMKKIMEYLSPTE